jgi:prephenate dehydratase
MPPVRAAYLGPPGTNSDEALSAAAPELEAVPLATLRDVVLSVQHGQVERALAPVENALEGGVDPVLDALALEAPYVSLIGEVLQPVSYCLAAGRKLALDEITMVRSHPQALGQCKDWLAEHMPDAAVVPAASTADAVREVAQDRDGTHAAIGPRLAARRYGAVMLAEGIEDDPGNTTRFAWIAPLADAPPPPESGPAKTSLVFWGSGSGDPGWLVSCLAVFAFAGVNLSRIESRPLRRGMGEYMFFLDLEASMADPAVSGAVQGLRRHAELVRVLGSFATEPT